MAAALAVQGLGQGRVQGVAMPHRTSNPASLADAEAVAAVLGVPLEVREITGMADLFLEDIPGSAAAT